MIYRLVIVAYIVTLLLEDKFSKWYFGILGLGYVVFGDTHVLEIREMIINYLN